MRLTLPLSPVHRCMNDYPNKIRIIGGKWRHRYIRVPSLPELRPTPNRIRETLFNWLDPMIPDAHCLDLFAGSGALGFEALSRGANHVTFVEVSTIALTALKRNSDQLKAEGATIINAAFPSIPALPQPQYDIIFLDPPFHQAFITPALNWLLENALLKTHSLIYMETEYPCPWLSPPTPFLQRRIKQTRHIVYQLWEIDMALNRKDGIMNSNQS